MIISLQRMGEAYKDKVFSKSTHRPTHIAEGDLFCEVLFNAKVILGS